MNARTSSSGKQTQKQEPQREGVGQGLGFSYSLPADTTDWRTCPDCRVWVHGRDRRSCPNCGFIFGQVGQDRKA